MRGSGLVPDVYYAAYDDKTDRCCLLLEDLQVSQEAAGGGR